MAANSQKTMSSRLMTMKFMQRSAAKNTASTPSTPNGPPSKKMRMSNGGSAPGTPGTPDHEILQAALAAEEQKRQEALDKAAQHAGETKWVLSVQDSLQGRRADFMVVAQAGYAELDADSDSDDDEEEARPIRRQFGGGLKKPEKPSAVEDDDEGEGETDSSSDEYDSDDPTAALIRETKREVVSQSRKSQKANTSQHKDLARTRAPHADSSLKGLSSISGGQQSGRGFGGPRDLSNVDCFKCGQKGHLQSNCPKSRGSAGRGGSRGRR